MSNFFALGGPIFFPSQSKFPFSVTLNDWRRGFEAFASTFTFEMSRQLWHSSLLPLCVGGFFLSAERLIRGEHVVTAGAMAAACAAALGLTVGRVGPRLAWVSPTGCAGCCSLAQRRTDRGEPVLAAGSARLRYDG